MHNNSFLSSSLKNSNKNNQSHDFSDIMTSFNMLVGIRIRPLHYKEALITPVQIVELLEEKTICLSRSDNHSEEESEEKFFFNFDYVFDHSIDQQNLYKICIKPLLNTLTNGYNVSIFVYGATGTGKTYTMIGNNDNPGIIFHVLQDLFFKLEDTLFFTDYVIKVSFIEVYNENIKDLLSKSEKSLDIWEDPIRGSIIVGVKEIPVSSTDEIIEILRVGSYNRTKESNGINETSSRSHAIMQIVIEYKNKNQGIEEEINIAKLNLIDLAGSEKTSNLTISTKKSKRYESSKINQSLLVLTNCIQILSKQSEKGVKLHIPYRNSKLTRLLKDTLGGNSRTLMIGTISSSLVNFEETYNTLTYATQAKKIRSSIVKNMIKVSNHLANYTQIISNLKKENEDLKKLLKDKNVSNDMKNLNNKGLEELKYSIQSHFTNELDVSKRILSLNEQLKHIEEQYDKNTKETYDQEEICIITIEFNDLSKKLNEKKKEFEKTLCLLQQKRSNFLDIIRGLNDDWKQYLITFYQEKLLIKENKIKNPMFLDLKDIEISCILNQIEIRDKIILSQTNLFTSDNRTKNDKKALDLIQNNKFIIRNRGEILEDLYANHRNIDYNFIANKIKPQIYLNVMPIKSKRSLSYHMNNLNNPKSIILEYKLKLEEGGGGGGWGRGGRAGRGDRKGS